MQSKRKLKSEESANSSDSIRNLSRVGWTTLSLSTVIYDQTAQIICKPPPMKIVIHFLLLISLLASTCIHASGQPGEKEYLAAIDIRDKVISLMEQYEEDGSNAQAPEKKQAIRSSLLEYAPQYNEKLKTSSDLGFPPAQFLYAQALTEQALRNTEKRASIKIEVCTLLKQAAKNGLLAAAVGAASYCSSTGDTKDFLAIIKATEKTHTQLEKNLASEDHYATFYPLKGFSHPLCYGQDFKEIYSTLDQLTPLQKIQALTPPLMTLEETRAEGYYLLATYMQVRDRVKAKEYFTRAEYHGCSIELFVK